MVLSISWYIISLKMINLACQMEMVVYINELECHICVIQITLSISDTKYVFHFCGVEFLELISFAAAKITSLSSGYCSISIIWCWLYVITLIILAYYKHCSSCYKLIYIFLMLVCLNFVPLKAKFHRTVKKRYFL